MRPRLGLVVALAAAVLLLVGTAAWLTLSQPAASSRGVASIGGSFELIDQNGRAVTDRYLLGKPSAIFFGFTHCPDVCPTTLLQMSTWLGALGADADKLNAVFVSVDWERDTPEQLKLYLSSFDPRIRGFTGTEAQIRRITKAYRVYYKRVELDGGGFTYDHSAAIYLMSRSGSYFGVLGHNDADDEAVAKLKRLIAAGQ
jgi:protein SCO1